MSHCNTDKFNYFWICEPLARCAKRGSSLPLGTPMEIDFTSAYLHYPLPQCSKIVTPIIFSISYELFRLPSAKVPQDYQLLRTFVWCLMEKVTRNNGPFLDMTVWEQFLVASSNVHPRKFTFTENGEYSESLNIILAAIVWISTD